MPATLEKGEEIEVLGYQIRRLGRLLVLLGIVMVASLAAVLTVYGRCPAAGILLSAAIVFFLSATTCGFIVAGLRIRAIVATKDVRSSVNVDGFGILVGLIMTAFPAPWMLMVRSLSAPRAPMTSAVVLAPILFFIVVGSGLVLYHTVAIVIRLSRNDTRVHK
jgi:hypothetical protein